MSETTEESPDKFFVIGDKSDTDKRFYINGSSGHVGINKIPTTDDTLCVNGNVKTDNLTVNTSATIGNGNVGIGTTSPSEKLQVNGNVELRNTDSHGDVYLSMFEGGADNGMRLFVDGTDNALQIQGVSTAPPTTATAIMTVERGGNVGIGTTSPSELLHLSSTGSVKILLEADTNNDNNDEGEVPCLLMTQDNKIFYHSVGGREEDNALRIETGSFYGNWSSATESPIVFHTGGSTGFHSGTERMRIDRNGNVGIGTTLPLGKLHIVEENGSAPSVSTGTIILEHENNGGQNSIVFRSKYNYGTDHGFITYQDDYQNLPNSERSLLTIGSGNDETDHISLMPGFREGKGALGNVGIGTTTPQYKLDVVGDINFTGDITKNGSGGLIPRGGIIMWSNYGGQTAVPTGFALCNGSNGTPDLRDRFIVSTGDHYSVGNKGGSNQYNLTTAQLPSHTHTGTTNHDGSHYHSKIYWDGPNGMHELRNDDFNTSNQANQTSANRGDGGDGYRTGTGNSAHSHNFTTSSTGSGDQIENRPAYYALAYIMKT